MLHFHTKNPNNTETGTSSNSKSLFAFKPRQVLLAEHNSRSKMNDKMEIKSKITSLTPELKGSLHNSILDYLHRHGFSKTLKRFQSEAEVQGDAWKASSLHLEDIFCKYNACNADSNLNTNKKPGSGSRKTSKKRKLKNTLGALHLDVLENDEAIKIDELCATKETITKKKKKSAIESDNGAIEDQSNVLEMDDKKSKDKKKKDIQQDKLEPSTTDNDNEVVAEVAKKEKKKKKKKSSTESDTQNETTQPDESTKEKVSSKKRKRSLSDENDKPTTEITITEESKRQKTETSKGEKSKKEGSKVDEINAQETSNGQANGKLEIDGGEKSGAQKSTKKQRKDSAEPKTVNAFQRVKIDEVEFAHQKLQDNSYWAKDGADIGYGAKAQEVLGQVRGRDFRHEKTKKKRGSYRGGLIDQDSHSIKFNYSDEE